MEETEPESSISLPNSAPNRNKGKNCATNWAALSMKVCVQLASNGSAAKVAAIRPAIGASRRMLHPEGKENEKSERDKDAEKTHGSELRQELVDVKRRRLAKVVAVRDQEIIRGLAAFL